MHYEEGQVHKTIARKIPAIKNWLTNFEAEMTQKESIMEEQTKPEVPLESISDLEMREEISRLKEELKLERLRSDAYEEMTSPK